MKAFYFVILKHLMLAQSRNLEYQLLNKSFK